MASPTHAFALDKPSQRDLAARQPPRAWRRGVAVVLRSPSATIGAILIAILIVLFIIGPTIAPHDPLDQDLMAKQEGPSLSHLLGTDNVGRDTLSRLLYGLRISLSISTWAILAALVIGIPIGLVAGYAGGLTDNIVTSVVDILLTLPTFLLAIFIVSLTSPSRVTLSIAILISTLPTVVRIVRSDTLSIRSWDATLAARAIGARPTRILFRHIFPNITGSIAVIASLQIGSAILVEASLSFLGLGLSPPTPSWGLMINDGLRYLSTNPWIAVGPGVAIMLTVLGFNLLGDGLRDALDPRTRAGRN